VVKLYAPFGALVVSDGPPATPFGSMVPAIHMWRFGPVGPSTEQW
jgi:hypothetical protein